MTCFVDSWLKLGFLSINQNQGSKSYNNRLWYHMLTINHKDRVIIWN